MAWSYVLDFENSANPFIERQSEISKWKNLADAFTAETEEILSTMDGLVRIGLKPIDALHVACAISMECGYFLTVDKGILRKADDITPIIIINPVILAMQGETG